MSLTCIANKTEDKLSHCLKPFLHSKLSDKVLLTFTLDVTVLYNSIIIAIIFVLTPYVTSWLYSTSLLTLSKAV